MRMIDLMSDIQAIHNTAKRYHWQCQGHDFYEAHLFFDRIAETFNEDSIDTLAEAWYMNDGREYLINLNDFDQLVSEKVGKKFSKEELNSKDIELKMFKILASMIFAFRSKLTTEEFGQGVGNKLDELAQSASQILGLIRARIADNLANVVTSRLKRNFK